MKIKVSCECKDFLALGDLTEFQGGLKSRTEFDVDKIVRSIRKYGIALPLFVWRHDGVNHCLDGHGRLLALKRMADDGDTIPPLPVVYVDCRDERSARDLLLRLNSHYGTMTKESVLEFIGGFDLDIGDFELPAGKIDFDMGEMQETEGDDEVPDVDEKEEPDSQPGEMYELGNSILMCGDSTDPDAVARLMGGEKADVCFTSPPYNIMRMGHFSESKKVKLTYINPREGRKIYDVYSDDLTDDQYADLLKNALKNGLEHSEDVLFNIGILAGSKRGLSDMLFCFSKNFSEMLFWNKSNFLPRGLESYRHCVAHKVEPIFCFNKTGKGSFSFSTWAKGTMTNEIKTGNGSKNEFAKEHHATFPVELPEYIVRNFTKTSILDLFGGTGTTLIAAEKLERKCFLMELSPHYCDLIRRRYTKWAKENGKPITSGCLE